MKSYPFNMGKFSFIFLVAFATSTSKASWFGPDNYWECLLKDLRDVHTDTIAEEIVKSCKDTYPFHERIFIEKKNHWFGIKTATKCVLKYGKDIQSEVSAKHIQAACYKLYPEN